MIHTEIKGQMLCLETSEKLFSPSAVDRGTLAMLSVTEFSPDDKILDLGCGCGVVGILAAKLTSGKNVTMCDISPDAVNIARKNAVQNGIENITVIQSDGFSNITDSGYTLILSNPPYHTDFSVAKGFIENGYKRLAVGGRMIMVTKRLDWYKNKLTSVFDGVRVKEIDGYFVFTAEKRADKKSKPEKAKKNTLSKKLQRKYSKPKRSSDEKN